MSFAHSMRGTVASSLAPCELGRAAEPDSCVPHRRVVKHKAQTVYFATPAELRAFFEEHHATATELSVGYYKRDSGIASITWPESVDQALCFGWIDGVRNSIDDKRYRIRFTPRKPTSIWSLINIGRVK